MLFLAEVHGILGVGCRDEIPAGAALADVIERGEFAGEGVGLLVGRRRGRDETDMLGLHRNRRQHRDRLEHRRPVGRAAGGEELRLVQLPNADAVGEEDQIEFAALGDLRAHDAVLEVHHRGRPRVGMTPSTEMSPKGSCIHSNDHFHDGLLQPV